MCLNSLCVRIWPRRYWYFEEWCSWCYEGQSKEGCNRSRDLQCSGCNQARKSGENCYSFSIHSGNVWCFKFCSKHSTILPLCLLQNLTHQTLISNYALLYWIHVSLGPKWKNLGSGVPILVTSTASRATYYNLPSKDGPNWGLYRLVIYGNRLARPDYHSSTINILFDLT